MKFKLFGIIWDFSVVVEMLYVMVGMLLIVSPFILPEVHWGWSVLYGCIFIIFMATVEDITKKLEDMTKT